MISRAWAGNGVEGSSGSYFGLPLDPVRLTKRLLVQKNGAPIPRMPLPDIDPNNLAEAGWAIVFQDGYAPALRDALRPLLEHRREEANREAGNRYRELIFYPGERKNQFLVRHGVGPGPVIPERLPYYLLFVGNPGQLSFDFQEEIGLQYAVGRLDFASFEDYGRYAQTVVDLEKTFGERIEPTTAIFAPANPGDRATELSRVYLAEPLADRLVNASAAVIKKYGDQARKEELALLLGDRVPDLLFTASHGMGYAANRSLQTKNQGALVCQDWPGPEAARKVSERHYFAGSDLDPASDLHGLIACLFACYSAGTPRWSRFAKENEERRELASVPFVADLPRRLLSHVGGAAQAVIGRVDRAWGCSFLWAETGRPQIQTFAGTLGGILAGQRVGWAMECLAQRYGELAVALFMALERARSQESDPDEVARLWTAARDAQGWILLGDPAVKIAKVAMR